MASIEYVDWENPFCSANVAESAYRTQRVNIDSCMLWRAEFRIPPGHQGLTGICLFDSGSFVIPYDPVGPTWLIGDDDLLEYNYGKQLGSNVRLAFYNLDDTYDHGWQVRLIYTPNSAVLVDVPLITVEPAVLV